MRKLGNKAKKIWRTSPHHKRARKPDDQQYAQEDHQYISRPDSGTGPSQTPASDRAGPQANSSGTSREATRTAQDTEEGQVILPYIDTPPQKQVASSPPVAVEAGLLPKLSSELLSRSETRHHTTFQQLQHPAETGWHEPHVIKEQKRKGKQRDELGIRFEETL